MNETNEPDPSTIIEHVAKAYATCTTYQDHGVVETTYHSGTPTEMKSKIWFTTYFKRPNKFRFAFLLRAMESFLFPEFIHVIWTDGKSVHIKSPIWLFTQERNLEMAIAGATGISSCAAHRVPRFLMPDVVGGKATDIKQAEYVKAEAVEAEICHRIHKASGSRQDDHWISQSRSVILRVQERDVIGPNMFAGMDQNRAQLQSFESLLDWLATKLNERMVARMQPLPITTDTYYRKVVLNEPLPDAIFSEHGRK